MDREEGEALGTEGRTSGLGGGGMDIIYWTQVGFWSWSEILEWRVGG